MEQQENSSQLTREERFVNGVIQRCRDDKGLAARLRRADNPATEYQSWEFLASLGIDLEKDFKRLPFVAVSAAIAKAKSEKNGVLSLGQAIAACYADGPGSNQAKACLRRLLACDELPEVCRILRSLLALIDSKVGQPIDFARLLTQLNRFAFEDSRLQVKAQWAQEFYSATMQNAEGTT